MAEGIGTVEGWHARVCVDATEQGVGVSTCDVLGGGQPAPAKGRGRCACVAVSQTPLMRLPNRSRMGRLSCILFRRCRRHRILPRRR